jgi:hypothetical protein
MEGATLRSSYVYAFGQIETRFPRPSMEKEVAQATGRAETAGQTNQQAFHQMMQAALPWSLQTSDIRSLMEFPSWHRHYLHRLNRFLGTQLRKLETFSGDPADRFWAEPQSLELQKRIIAVRAGQTGLESAYPDAERPPYIKV